MDTEPATIDGRREVHFPLWVRVLAWIIGLSYPIAIMVGAWMISTQVELRQAVATWEIKLDLGNQLLAERVERNTNDIVELKKLHEVKAQGK